MNTLTQIATVAELQRNYRPLVTSLKKSGKPLIIVSNGKPDIIIMDINSFESREKDLQTLEEIYLMSLATNAIQESNQKKTITPRADQTLLDILDTNAS